MPKHLKEVTEISQPYLEIPGSFLDAKIYDTLFAFSLVPDLLRDIKAPLMTIAIPINNITVNEGSINAITINVSRNKLNISFFHWQLQHFADRCIFHLTAWQLHGIKICAADQSNHSKLLQNYVCLCVRFLWAYRLCCYLDIDWSQTEQSREFHMKVTYCVIQTSAIKKNMISESVTHSSTLRTNIYWISQPVNTRAIPDCDEYIVVTENKNIWIYESLEKKGHDSRTLWSSLTNM